jgi:hypothetical protein
MIELRMCEKEEMYHFIKFILITGLSPAAVYFLVLNSFVWNIQLRDNFRLKSLRRIDQ